MAGRTPQRVAEVGEFGLIARIQALLEKEGARCSRVSLGPGDDAAAFRPRPGFEVLVTCDCLVEGRHFLKDRIGPMDLGRRAMVMNISDIGAMGGVPVYALVSLGLQGDTPITWIDALYRGFLEELNPLQACIIGGNLTESAGGLFLDITLIGEIESPFLTRRSSARAGDVILVTGYPGQAAAGLKLLQSAAWRQWQQHPVTAAYLRPPHRAREARRVARSGLASAMMDLSDGLVGDLGHICRAANVGGVLYEDRLPVSKPLEEASQALDCPVRSLVLGPSDDYELLLTCRPERVAEIRRLIQAAGPVPVHEVGRLTERPCRIGLAGADGRVRPVPGGGWDHFSP